MKSKTLKTMTCAAMATTLSISPFLALTEAYAMSQMTEPLVHEEVVIADETVTDTPAELIAEENEMLSSEVESEIETEEVGQLSKVEETLEDEIESEIEIILEDVSEASEDVLPQSMDAEAQPLESEISQEVEEKNSNNFVLSDWVYTQNSKYITITGAKNSKTSIYIPGEYNGKQIILKDLKIFPSTMTSLKILAINGKKVLLNTDYLGFSFSNNKNLKTLELSGLDTSKVTDMNYLFDGLKNLTSINLSGWNTSNVEDMRSMFYGVESLTSLDLSSFNTSKVTDMGYMFNGMKSLTSLNIKSFNTSKVTDMGGMFQGLESMKTLDVSMLNTANVTNMEYMFSRMTNLTTLNLSNFNTSKVKVMSGMFYKAEKLTSLNIKSFNTGNVEHMGGMFQGMQAITSLDLSHFNTSKVVQMDCMFNATPNLKTLNISSFNTSKVKGMYAMFAWTGLTSLDLRHFDTANVEDMSYLFSENEFLTSINVLGWETENVTNMRGMFSEIPLLTSIDLSSFKTPKLEDVSSMFFWSSGLNVIDLSQFDFSKVKDSTYFLYGRAGNPNQTLIIGQEEFLRQYQYQYADVDVVGIPEIFSSTTAIAGKGTVGSKIEVSLNGNALANTTIDTSGNYSLTIPKQASGVKLSFKITAPNGVQTTKTVQVQSAFKNFTIKTTIAPTTTAVYGTGEPGAKVGVYLSNGTRLAVTTVNANGNFKLVIPKQKAGTTLTFKQSKEGYTTVSKQVKVYQEFKTFTYDTPTNATTAIYGKGVAGAKVGIYTTSGKRLAITSVNSKGNYKLVIPKQKAGTKLVIKQAKSGYITLSKNVTVLNQLKTFTYDTPTTATTAIYGKGVAGAKVGIYTSNGKCLAIATVNSKGNYKLVIPKQKAGTKLVIKQAKSGYLTVSKNVTVLNVLKTFTHSTVKASSTTINGKGVSGAKVGVYDKNGKQVAITTVNSKGNYKLVIPKQKAGAKLVLKQAKSGYLTVSKNITVVKG